MAVRRRMVQVARSDISGIDMASTWDLGYNSAAVLDFWASQPHQITIQGGAELCPNSPQAASSRRPGKHGCGCQ